MDQRFTPEQLNRMDHKTKDGIICQMQERLDRLEQDYENLVEQIRLANQERFGRKTEKLDEIAGQMSFFNEAEACFSETAEEPAMEEVVARAVKPARKQKKKGQREEDLKDFPQEEICHDIPEEELDDSFGKGNWKCMLDEVFWLLRFESAKWVVEKHMVKVYAGTGGRHQDEFLRGDHPATLFRGGIVTPSLEAAVINTKYVNNNPLDRIAWDFQVNGLNLSKQTDVELDGLEQYHKLAKDQEGITNANFMAHARRHFANAIKAAGQKDKKSIQSSIAYQELVRIVAVYDLEKGLKDLGAEERLEKRQKG